MHTYSKEALKQWVDSDYFAEDVAEDELIFVVRADTLLFPQYDVEKSLREFMDSSDVVRWLGVKAFEELKGDRGVPEVRDHWRMLVEIAIRDKERSKQL